MTTQTNAQHTAGPWKTGRGGDGHYRVYNKRGTVICQFGYGEGEERQELRNAEANARLIAAAPDLLAAAEWVTDLDAGASSHRMLRAAIRKARGEE